MDAALVPVNEAPWKNYSILVVDDEPGMLSFLQRALAPRCGGIDTAGSIEQAEPMLRRHHYDLIVLDIALPGRSGIDWLHQLRDEGYAGDVVLMTPMPTSIRPSTRCVPAWPIFCSSPFRWRRC